MKNFYFKFREGEFFGDIIEALKKLGGVTKKDSIHSHLIDGIFTLDENKKIVFYPCDTNLCTKLLFNGVCLTSDFQLCVYFRGNSDNAKEIINFLEFLGGRDGSYTSADDSDCLIFIDNDGDINECSEDSGLGISLQNKGLELSQDLFMLDSEGPSIEILGNYYSRREVTKLLRTLQKR
jgi:hypothetical protein